MVRISVWAIFPDGIAWVIKMNYGPDWLPFNTMKTSYSNGKVSVEPLESHSFSFILGYYSGDALGNNKYISFRECGQDKGKQQYVSRWPNICSLKSKHFPIILCKTIQIGNNPPSGQTYFSVFVIKIYLIQKLIMLSQSS